MFRLQIVTPDGLMFDDEAQILIVRTTEGDVGILAGHADYVSPLLEGTAKITMENGDTKTANCSGGLVSVNGRIVRVVAEAFEWK